MRGKWSTNDQLDKYFCNTQYLTVIYSILHIILIACGLHGHIVTEMAYTNACYVSGGCSFEPSNGWVQPGVWIIHIYMHCNVWIIKVRHKPNNSVHQWIGPHYNKHIISLKAWWERWYLLIYWTQNCTWLLQLYLFKLQIKTHIK